MAEEDKNFAGYYAATLDEDGTIKGFHYGTDLGDLKKNLAAGDQLQVEPENESVESEAEDAAPSNTLEIALRRACEVGLSLTELIMASNNARALYGSFSLQIDMHHPVQKSATKIESYEGREIYGLTGEQFRKVREKHRRLTRADRGFEILPSAIFLAIIATFDTLLSDIIRDILRSDSGKLKLSGKSLQVSDLLKMGSFDEIIDKVVDEEIYSFSRGSHEEQVEYIERMFDIKIVKPWKRWPDFVEIFERRNLVAHGSVNFNQRYVSKCHSAGHKGAEKFLGEKVELTDNYIKQSLDIIIEFLVLAIFSIWRKIEKSEEQHACSVVNAISYDFILNKRYRSPLRILEYVLSLNGINIDESTKRMMTINLASFYKHSKQSDKSKEILEKTDWSACADNFQICVAALRAEVDDVVRLMPRVFANGQINKFDFRDWPVFDYVREDPKFSEAFKHLVGEDLFDTTDMESSSGGGEKKAAGGGSDSTVH